MQAQEILQHFYETEVEKKTIEVFIGIRRFFFKLLKMSLQKTFKNLFKTFVYSCNNNNPSNKRGQSDISLFPCYEQSF